MGRTEYTYHTTREFRANDTKNLYLSILLLHPSVKLAHLGASQALAAVCGTMRILYSQDPNQVFRHRY